MSINKKKALGRGLGALIDDANEPDVETSPIKTSSPVNEIKLDDIQVNPFQPRTQFDEDALLELAESIQELGIIQPITVRELGNGKYQLISGERRYRAARLAALDTIVAYVRHANDQEMLEMALVENIQREELDAIEIAISYQRLIEECSLTQEVLSGRVGKKRTTVANYLRLLKLPAEVQLAIRNKKISMGHARALLGLENHDLQVEYLFKTIEQDLSVRAVEDLVREHGKPKEHSEEILDSNSNEVENEELRLNLANYFKTPVDLKLNNKGRGKIVISFKSNKELERILNLFGNIEH